MTGMVEADLLLRGGYVVPQERMGQVIEDGAVAIRGNRIVDVGAAAEVGARVRATRTIECGGRAILPGLVDCHVHTCQSTARGLADDVPVGEWLTRIVGFEAYMQEEDVVASVRLACLEMIKSGTTGFIEACMNPLYVDAAAEVVAEAGLRCALTRSNMEQREPTWDAPDAFIQGGESSVDATRAMIKRWNGAANGRINAWSGWRHAQDTSDELLIALVGLMDEFGVGLHAHLATRQYGEVERLERIGALRPGMVFAHGIRYTAREVELLKYHDVKIDHNPGASLHGAYGASRVGQFPEMLAQGVCVCLGCDAAANNNTLDMFRTMYLAATIHKDARCDASMIPAPLALQMATSNGARACGWDDLGALAPGKKADLIVVNLLQPHLMPIDNVINNLVYCASGQDVETTIVDGQILMEQRRVAGLDEAKILREAVESAERVKARWRERAAAAAH
jgi:5-methylthioadenosine/S-adenosylhomocysteine deaminase